MLKRLIAASALVGLTLAGSAAAADNLSPSTQRQLRTNFGLVVELSARGGQDEGVAVKQVLPNSPAFRAGLRKGDLITRIGRFDIENFADLDNALKLSQAGERMRFQVEREGEQQFLSLTPRLAREDEEDRESTTRYGRNNGEGNGNDTRFQRLQQSFRRLESRLQEMERQGQNGESRGESTEQTRAFQRMQRRLDDLEERVGQARRSDQYGRNTTGATLGAQTRPWRRQSDSRQGGTAEEGVMVTAINPDSAAAECGLRRGDIITRVDNRDVSTPQELRQALQRGGQETTLEVLRGSRSMMLNVRLEGGSRYGARDRRYERLEERIEQLENRLREMEQNP
ncbi:MAG: PDZ domain-containing protein [Gemmataceae bacterium]